MVINRPVDIEDTVRAILAENEINAFCRPLPPEFGLPLILISNIGGSTEETWAGTEVMDTFTVVLDARAETEGAALDLLRTAVGVLKVSAANQSTAIRYVTLNTQYSWGSDPVRPDLAMCSANLSIRAHSECITI